uniref:Type II secretion system protein n=1 Tax=uncultured bacterium A1Q1_fos_517 TaxID=1256582 RepID=L7VZI6_9BACT|nr:hypothetical protein [uncultured bacterium A1Q1_fos_517]
MVVMLITVMSIAVAITLPAWSGMIQRDKEEELIARGLQYAEAIRVFQRRFGRLPVQLDELIRVEPRSIRRLWDDPMTGKADWIVILEGTPQGGSMIDPATGQPVPQPGQSDPQDPQGGADGEPPPQPIGPIRGVRSRATGEAFHVFLDQAEIGSWEFRSDIFNRFRTAPSENGIPRVSALTLGRPFRYVIAGNSQNPPGMPMTPPGAPGSPPVGKPKLRSQADRPASSSEKQQ